MKAKDIIFYGLIAAMAALAFTGCPPEPDPKGGGTPPHTHTYPAAWSKDATNHWHECTANDGAKTDIAPHQWQWVETTPATTQAPGQETETCVTCGATSGNTRPIAQLEQPHEQTPVTINLALGGNYTATVKGNLTDTQWNGVAAKIESAIKDAYTNVPAGILGFQQQNIINGAFVDNNVVIIVEKTTEYSIYKVVAGNKTTLYVNIDGLDNLQSNVVKAATAMGNGEASIDGVQQQPQPCACLTTHGATAHLGIDAQGNVAPCACGGNPCNCTEQTDQAYNVPIRKYAAVTVQQMNDTATIIKTIMDDNGFTNKDSFAVRITAIHIVPGTTLDYQNKIFTVGHEAALYDIAVKIDEIYNIVMP